MQHASATSPWLVEMNDVVMRYGGVVALKGVSLRVGRGSVHGLLGENGAGKSTLVKIIAGLAHPTSGEVTFEGDPVISADVREMEERGVFLVTQEPMIVDPMTVMDNLMLGRWPARGGFVRDAEMRRLAGDFLAEANLDPRRIAGTLSAVEKRKLNILRALHSGGRLIILDEPTAALTMADKVHLFDFMRALKQAGVSFLFISHYNEEILEICDEVSVLRDGVMIGQNQSVARMDSDALSEMVIGRDVKLFRRAPAAAGAAAWSLRNIRRRGLAVDSLDIARGEIIGFAGLPGSGAQELGRAIYGLLPAHGEIVENGRQGKLPRHPAEAIERGIAFLSEDRLRDGVIATQSIEKNISISSLGKLSRLGWMSQPREAALAKRFFPLFAIKAASTTVSPATLSGGNQQKVLLARLVATAPRLVILNEPTRGIDVGAKEEVHRLVDELTQDGVSVIVITSDLDEMLRVADRIALFVDGEISAIRNAQDLTKEDIFATSFQADDAMETASTGQRPKQHSSVIGAAVL